MSIVRAFMITIASGVAFAILGAVLGVALGFVAPDYYRAVFRVPLESSINAAQVGLGLGLTQGGICGLVIGLAIVAIIAWSRKTVARQ